MDKKQIVRICLWPALVLMAPFMIAVMWAYDDDDELTFLECAEIYLELLLTP